MHFRGSASVVIFCLGIACGGCRSTSKPHYEEVLMPLQTGSVLHRRVEVKSGPEAQPKKQKKKEKEKSSVHKPEAEPSATPAPEEESTPPPDRFR